MLIGTAPEDNFSFSQLTRKDPKKRFKALLPREDRPVTVAASLPWTLISRSVVQARIIGIYIH